jgi:NAD(P)-dependent dehydrogenase (short-subunit alcohol dehydrogenase family)
MVDFTGKTILVTGGASGIGFATAELLVEAGANLVLADRDQDACTKAAQNLNRENIVALRADVTSEDDVIAMIEAAVSRFGRLDGACNAAGVPQTGKLLHEVSLEEWDRCHRVNLRGTFICNKYEIATMLKSGGGSIVNIVSTAAMVGFPNGAEYCASKSGVLGLVRGAAIDYATKGIRINSVLPGATDTPMLAGAFQADPGLEAALAAVHPMGRLAKPTEIAAAARWLLSEEASFVTGASYAVDGGHTAI